LIAVCVIKMLVQLLVDQWRRLWEVALYKKKSIIHVRGTMSDTTH